MPNNIEWADTAHPFPPEVITYESLAEQDPEDHRLEYEWGAAVFAGDGVAISSDSTQGLAAWFARLTDQVTELATAELPIEHRPSIRLDSVGGSENISARGLLDLLESDGTFEDAIETLREGRVWVDQNRLVEHGPRGYREAQALDSNLLHEQVLTIEAEPEGE